ncbi:MAG: hypothetical protein KDC12_00275 [Flavobacteriales bacterium]|nr:hypothetical protein [Flavobacteriales bacterium]
MLEKINRLMEPFWLVIALVALGTAFYEYFQNKWEGQAGLMFGIAGLAFIWFGTRRALRKRLESREEE